MSHSSNLQYVHMVWCTKNLHPLITDDSQSPLLAYLSGILRKSGGHLIASSVTPNHVHLLANIPTDIAMSVLLCDIKAYSSKWYHKRDEKHVAFCWNEGYSAFTVSPASIENVKQYFANENYRHKNISFEDELTGFLEFHEIAFKPRFLINTTFTKLIYHFVWSVKHRENILNSNIQIPLQRCIQEQLQKNKCKLYAVGNVSDHIHILFESNSTVTTSNLVQNLKTATSHLIKSLDAKCSNFSWQEGYGVFSVGKPALKIVTNYVNNQEQHHKTKTFDQEWNWLLGV